MRCWLRAEHYNLDQMDLENDDDDDEADEMEINSNVTLRDVQPPQQHLPLTPRLITADFFQQAMLAAAADNSTSSTAASAPAAAAVITEVVFLRCETH